MSARQAAIIRDDIDRMGPVLKRDIADAQNVVLKHILKMIDAGELVISRGEEYLE